MQGLQHLDLVINQDLLMAEMGIKSDGSSAAISGFTNELLGPVGSDGLNQSRRELLVAWD